MFCRAALMHTSGIFTEKNMTQHILLFILGLILLIKGGDWFVDGAVGIARRFNVPELLIGATVVSIGTTLPEVMVSATSAAEGFGAMAYGNAIGSVICNTALIAALVAAFRPSDVNRRYLRTPVAFFFGAALLYVGAAYTTKRFSRGIGIALLAIFAAYMILQVRDALISRVVPTEKEKEEAKENLDPAWKSVLLLAVGAGLIAWGATLLVDHGIAIAEALGVPQTVIALTFVALGTSLPELVTAVTSIVKGHGSLSVGNVCGANLFNLVLVSGLSITIGPFRMQPPEFSTLAVGGREFLASLVIDTPVMLIVMMLLTLPALATGKLRRWQGVTLLCIYAGFCALQFIM